MNKIEIKTWVRVSGDYGTTWINVEITEGDLFELAKKKALENFDSSWYNQAQCEEIESIRTNL
jgi:hypothetical protein